MLHSGTSDGLVCTRHAAPPDIKPCDEYNVCDVPSTASIDPAGRQTCRRLPSSTRRARRTATSCLYAILSARVCRTCEMTVQARATTRQHSMVPSAGTQLRITMRFVLFRASGVGLRCLDVMRLSAASEVYIMQRARLLHALFTLSMSTCG